MRLFNLIEFFFFYLYEVILSNLKVAADVLTPRLIATPQIVEVPLDPGISDTQAYWLACLVTMTPGTLTLDISPAKDRLILHVMYADSPQEVVAHIKQSFERRVRNVFR